MNTFEDVRGLSLEELQSRLAERGIDASREKFLELAAGEASARDVAVKWNDLRPQNSLPPHPDDFSGFAACRLWEAFLPDRPSLEMVDNWMSEGYEEETEDPGKACDLWWRVWEVLRDRLKSEMRCREDADAMCGDMQSFFNWTQDLELALYNASLKDPIQAERGIGFARELLARFPDDDELLRANTRRSLGELQFLAGRVVEGEGTLRALINECPDQATGYCALSDALRPTDPLKALAVLEEARDRPVRDGPDWSLEPRIEGLRKSLRERSDA